MRTITVRKLSIGSLTAITLVSLAGCATFGGNVKGNFQCNAPDGICAPTSSIDDQALAQIGEYSDAPRGEPARYYRMKEGSNAPVTASATGARGMRIVLPGRTDRFGRWREPQIVYADVALAGNDQVTSPASPGRLSLSELASGAPPLAAAKPAGRQALASPDAFAASIKQAYSNGLVTPSGGAEVAPAAPKAVPVSLTSVVAGQPAQPAPGAEAAKSTSPAASVEVARPVKVLAPAFSAPVGDDE